VLTMKKTEESETANGIEWIFRKFSEISFS
jgi:hypothetical protein